MTAPGQGLMCKIALGDFDAIDLNDTRQYSQIVLVNKSGLFEF